MAIGRTFTAQLVITDEGGKATMEAGPYATAGAAVAALARLAERLTREHGICDGLGGCVAGEGVYQGDRALPDEWPPRRVPSGRGGDV